MSIAAATLRLEFAKLAIFSHHRAIVKNKRLHWVTLGALRKDQDIVRTPLAAVLRPSVPMPVHEIGRAENLTRQPVLLGVGKADEVGTDGLDVLHPLYKLCNEIDKLLGIEPRV